MMKKYLILLVVFGFLFPLGTFAQGMSSFQKKLSCKVTGNTVRVYLLQEPETLKCYDYLSLLNTYLKIEYQSMIQIMINLNRGDDSDYRKSLYDTKKTQFLKLFSQRKMIQSAMDEFETELLNKSKAFLEATLLGKQEEVQKAIDQIGQIQYLDSSTKKSLKDLRTKQDVISKLIRAETMDDFIRQFTAYLTLFPIAQGGK